MDEAINAREAASIEADQIKANLDAVLTNVDNPQAAYRRLGPVGRKHSNIAFFEHIAVDINGVTSVQLSDTYAEVLAGDLVERLENEIKKPDLHFAGRGSREIAMVAGAVSWFRTSARDESRHRQDRMVSVAGCRSPDPEGPGVRDVSRHHNGALGSVLVQDIGT